MERASHVNMAVIDRPLHEMPVYKELSRVAVMKTAVVYVKMEFLIQAMHEQTYVKIIYVANVQIRTQAVKYARKMLHCGMMGFEFAHGVITKMIAFDMPALKIADAEMRLRDINV